MMKHQLTKKRKKKTWLMMTTPLSRNMNKNLNMSRSNTNSMVQSGKNFLKRLPSRKKSTTSRWPNLRLMTHHLPKPNGMKS